MAGLCLGLKALKGILCMNRTNTMRFNLIFLSLFLIFGGLLSVILQYELSWDFANYHYYNPWAFLNGRVHHDIGVAGLNAYFNPLMDIPLYLLIKYFNNYPYFIMFIQGLWTGALLFSFFKLTLLYFDEKTFRGKIAVFLSVCIALSGSALFLQIGTCSNEIMTAFFVVTALYFLIKNVFYQEKQSHSVMFFAGLVLGMAMGLKLTSFIYCISSGISLLLFYKNLQRPVYFIGWFILGGILGFLMTNGFWMIKLWEIFQNPFFPFANEFFKSEFMPTDLWRDTNFLPRNWYEFILWPVIISLTFVRAEGNNLFVADFRPLIVFIIFGVFLIKLCKNLLKNKKSGIHPAFAFLIVFELISFVLWEVTFSIVRYYIVIEMLFAIFIVKGIWGYSFKTNVADILYYTFLIFILFMLVSTPYFSDGWGKRNVSEKFADGKYLFIEDFDIPDNSLLLIYDYPSAAAIPVLSQRTNNLHVALIGQHTFEHIDENGKKTDLFDIGPWAEKRRDIIDKHQGPKMVLRTLKGKTRIDISKDIFFNYMSCRFVKNNIVPGRWMLCVPPELKNAVWQKSIERGEPYVEI